MVPRGRYDEDPIAPLRFAESLASLKEDVASTGGQVFIDLLIRLVLDNSHRATVALVPEDQLAAKVQAEEDAELEEMSARLDADGRLRVLQETTDLRAAQAAPDSAAAIAQLPVLSTADLNRAIQAAAPTEVSELSLAGGRARATLLTNELPTDGLIYMQIALPLERVDMADVPYLPLLGAMVSSFGTRSQDEMTFSRRIDAQTGGLSAGPQTTAVPGRGWTVGDREALSGYWMVSGRATSARAGELFGLAGEMLSEINLDNPSRVVEMLTQSISSAEASVVSSGNSYASTELNGRLSLAGHVDELMGGLSAMKTAREALVQAQQDWPTMLARLERMRTALLNANGAIVNLSADAPSMAAALKHVPTLLESLPNDDAPAPGWLRPTPSGILVPTNEGLQVPTQVNYVVKSACVYEPGEEVSGATSVITRYLGTSYLWDAVRVQGGAYGCSLGFSQLSGIATYSSYRDPNVASTLSAYDRTGDFLRSNPLSKADLDKAIIGATGDLDAPQSVSGKGSTAMLRHMLGITQEDRQNWRDQVLGTTAADFVDFADRLDRVIESGSVAVVASERAISEANGVLPESRRLEARRIL